MRLKKKHSRIIAFAIVFLCIVGAVILSAKNAITSTAPRFALTRNADGTIDASVIFGEFKKSEVKNGKKLWEVTAKVGTYHPQQFFADLEQVQVVLSKDEDTITMTSDKAKVFFNGNDLKDVDAQGNVIITSQARNTKIYSESFLYEKESERIHTQAPVKIVSPEMELNGEGLEGNTNLKSFSLLQHVQTTVQAKDSTKKKSNSKNNSVKNN